VKALSLEHIRDTNSSSKPWSIKSNIKVILEEIFALNAVITGIKIRNSKLKGKFTFVIYSGATFNAEKYSADSTVKAKKIIHETVP
jgi:hypothetical protein